MEPPRLVVPSAPHKDSYRALVAEFVARGEPLIPFPLSFPHENFEAFLAQLAGCELLDQRGKPRPADGDGDGEAHCDIGAVELAPEPAAGLLGAAR